MKIILEKFHINFKFMLLIMIFNVKINTIFDSLLGKNVKISKSISICEKTMRFNWAKNSLTF